MQILVTAASRHGSTMEVAEVIGQALNQAGFAATVKRVRDLDGVAGYGAVVLGSAVYMGRWLPEATDFVRRHRIELGARPVWLFSSGPTGGPESRPEGEPAGIANLVATVHALGHRTFGGRLERGRLGFGERLVISALRAREGDFRDQEAMKAWADEIARELAPIAALASAG